jgi:hypothetical protein
VDAASEVLETSEGLITVSEVRTASNPVTRSTVRIDPPFVYETQAQRSEFIRLFGEYCENAWTRTYRCDPKVVSADAVMAGYMSPDCVTAVHDALRPAVAEYGVFAVQAALIGIIEDKTGIRMGDKI